MNELKGIHHVTAITSSAEKIYEFLYLYIRFAFSEENSEPR